jgi:hypothetical protein
VTLAPESRRGGLLRQGSVLSVTSYATRTSPVLRGVLALRNILPPPSPAECAGARREHDGRQSLRCASARRASQQCGMRKLSQDD